MRWNHVALLAEGVDRNRTYIIRSSLKAAVALLAEGVDRNPGGCRSLSSRLVALLAEGVDRNSTNWTLTGPSTCRPPRGGRG